MILLKAFKIFFVVMTLSCAGFVHALAQDASSADDRSVRDALEDIRNGDIERGMEILQLLAEEAHPEALFHLAEMARLGVGRDKSMPIAIMYYRLSGQLGHSVAALRLAEILYFDSERTEAQLGEAASIWQSQALEGSPTAAFMLGMLYWNGEIGKAQDPVRGYGLVWRAAQAGYNEAVQAELTMRSQINGVARARGQAYGEALETEGFSDELLAMDLVIDGYSADVAETKDVEASEKPEDWSKVWRLEVGFAMGAGDAEQLLERILREEADTVRGLNGEVIESPNRVGMFRLVFGPIERMNDAVSRCVALKRAGHDCFAQPPSKTEP